MKRLLARLIPLFGLLLILAYWFSVRPIAGYPGYTEDLCITDQARQLMSQQLKEHGKPFFETRHVMTPEGAGVPYLSWQPERDWLGAYVWRWDPQFPFAWAFAGFSWVLSYLIAGFILRGIGRDLGEGGFGPALAWSFALIAVLFHVPRHFKIWHHWEHLIQHWVYLAYFLDAWLWVRFQRKRVWDWRIEAWRGLAGIGMLLGVGTFWGPLIFEWLIVHVSLLFFGWSWRRQGIRISAPSFRGNARFLVFPGLAGALIFWVALQWYLPLLAEARQFGEVAQSPGGFAHLLFFFRPLWLDPILAWIGAPALRPIDHPETVVSIGWLYWVPMILGLRALRKKKGGPGLRIVEPFLLLLVIAVLYATINEDSHFFQRPIQWLIPFMSYFRISSRWALFFPQIFTILIVLSWPELRGWWSERMRSQARLRWVAAALIFVLLSAVEVSWLRTPVNEMPPLTPPMQTMLEQIKTSPGTSVLNLPFCVAGGNAVCLREQCPQYPASTTGACLRIFHGKDVYGLYQGRMTEKHCEIYRKPPYESWFSAWREGRCFTDQDFEGFCRYLGDHPELSAVLLFVDIWPGASDPGCLARFDRYLGEPLSEASIMTTFTRNGQGELSRVRRYATRCLRVD